MTPNPQTLREYCKSMVDLVDTWPDWKLDTASLQRRNRRRAAGEILPKPTRQQMQISALQEQVERLKKALEPFAKAYEAAASAAESVTVFDNFYHFKYVPGVTLGDFLNAKVALASIPEAAQPQSYPCAKCGVSRTEAEGGKIFTVCDECWNARVPESNITEGQRPHNKWPTVASKREALNIARARAEGKAEGRAEGYREGQLVMRERAAELLYRCVMGGHPLGAAVDALIPEPLPAPPDPPKEST